MIHYKQVKIIIDAPCLAEVFIHMLICHHGLCDLIVCKQGSIFISKFWSLSCYFQDIKQMLSIAFHSQTDSQAERQNSTIDTYLRAIIH